jgi:hypothetical protein
MLLVAWQLSGHPKRIVMPPLMTTFVIPEQFVLRRWAKLVTKDYVSDGEGNLLKNLPKVIVETSNAKFASEIWSMMEELIQRAEGSNNGLQILQYRFFAFGEDIHILLPKRVTSQGKEIEAFVGCPIPREVIIYPP